MTIAIEKPRTRTRALTEPRIIEMPSERMAVVETVGDPNLVGKDAIPALYGAVYGLKFMEKRAGRDFKVRPLRARWMNWEAGRPTGTPHGIWGLPVPPITRAMPQKPGNLSVGLQTWVYGTVAEILHLGPYAAEAPTIARLLSFIHEQGYEVQGPHEEEYLSRPDARLPRTLIRYRVKRAAGDERRINDHKR